MPRLDPHSWSNSDQPQADYPETRALANELFDRFSPRYHGIAREVVRSLLSN